MPVEYGSLPFKEAVDYLKDKVNVPSENWKEFWAGANARVFTVAGTATSATKDALVADFRDAIAKALEQGTTLEEFRKDFDAIVARHGWDYNGGRNWRSRVIYETNMRTAYQAGRYEQLMAGRERRPYWQYKHSKFVKDPRPQHQRWDGRIWRWDDPIWKTLYPPNGWGCQCYVIALSERDLKRMGKSGPDEPLDLDEAKQHIDAGWAYNVGQAARGETLTEVEFELRKIDLPNRKDRYVRTITKGYKEAGRPQRMPRNPLPVPLAETTTSQARATEMIRDALSSNTYTVADLPVAIDPVRLAQHIDLRRSAYLPLLDDVLRNPYEVWMNFELDKVTSRYRTATRLVKGYEVEKGRWVMVVTELDKGQLIDVSFIISSSQSTINQERQGIMVQADEADNADEE